MRRSIVVVFIGLVALGLTLSSSMAQVVVGGKGFTEQLVLSQISVLALQANGIDVDDRSNLGSTFQNRTALVEGQIDTYWEYNGTAVSNFTDQLGIEVTDAGFTDTVTGEVAPVSSADGLTAYVGSRDAARNDIIWLPRTAFNDSFELVTTQAFAQANGLVTISDLAAAINSGSTDPSLCIGTEFRTRDNDGLPEIQRVYGFQFNSDNLVDLGTNLGLGADLLLDGTCDITSTLFTTDGRIPLNGWTVLADDQGVFPKFNPSPLVRGETLRANPAIGSVLGALGSQLTQGVQTCLNARVDILGEDPAEVAKVFLDTGGCPNPS